jgi:DNA-binding NarL/FixJ family response regulator
MPITVALIEDSDEIRESLTVLLRASPGYTLSGAYSTAEEALAKIPHTPPEVLLVDINLPGLSGIDCVRKLKLQLPALQVLMLTVYDDPDAIFDSLAAGASGYLLKRTPPTKLLEAITEVSQGGSPMSGQIARKVVQRFALPSTEPALGLTPREDEILAHLAKGYRYREIAEVLGISIETVRSHLHKIYEKLHVRSRTEAVTRYYRK